MTPTKYDLFQFSALSYNTHPIHYDQLYAESEGYPDVLIQGPFTLMLMLRVLSGKQDGIRIIPKPPMRAPGVPVTMDDSISLASEIASIQYRNIVPITPGQQLRICVKPLMRMSILNARRQEEAKVLRDALEAAGIALEEIPGEEAEEEEEGPKAGDGSGDGEAQSKGQSASSPPGCQDKKQEQRQWHEDEEDEEEKGKETQEQYPQTPDPYIPLEQTLTIWVEREDGRIAARGTVELRTAPDILSLDHDSVENKEGRDVTGNKKRHNEKDETVTERAAAVVKLSQQAWARNRRWQLQRSGDDRKKGVAFRKFLY